MSRYTSALFPPKEYHTIGCLRFPVYKALTPAETRVLNRLLRFESENQQKYILLAKRIATETGLNIGETLAAISDFRETSEKTVGVLNYIDDIVALGDPVKKADEALQMKLEAVTAFIRNRGQIKFEDAEEYVPTSDWELTDTEILNGYLDEVYQLAMWERNGWPETGDNDPGMGNEQMTSTDTP